MKRFFRVVGLSACLILASACNGAEEASSLDDVLVPLAPAASQNLCQTTSRVPTTEVGNALLWTLDALNLYPEYASETALLDRFDSSVFDTSSASALAASFRTLGGGRPFALAGFSELPGDNSISAVLASASSGYLQVRLETAANGRLTVLHFAPFVPPAEAPDCPEPTAEAAAPPANTPPAAAPPANAPPANANAPADAIAPAANAEAPDNAPAANMEAPANAPAGGQ